MNRRLLVVLTTVLFAATTAMAQQSGGSIKGTVKDETGAALPGATVSVSGPASRNTTAGNDGGYHFDNLPPGSYKVTAQLIGFGTQEQPAVSVTAGGSSDAPFTLLVVLRGEEVVVSASKVESSLVNAPATMSVVSNETIASSPAQNYGDLLRSVPGLNVIQTSARDINITSRQATSTLVNSQLTLLDGRSIYLDFFGLTLWDFVPSNPQEIKQIEVVRGPASAVWGANALTGVVNIITKSPRETEGLSLTFNGGLFDRDVGSTKGESSGKTFNGSATYAKAPNDHWSYKLSAGFVHSDPYARPTGSVPLSTHPLDSTIRTGGAPYPADNAAQAPGQNAFENTKTDQPKADLRVDYDTDSGGKLSFGGGYTGTRGIIHTGIGPFDIQDGSYMAYGKVSYTKGALKIGAFQNHVDTEAPNLLLVDPATLAPVKLNFKTDTFDFEIGHSTVIAQRHVLSYGGNARRNNFDITLAPQAENRNEFGAYFQDEIFFDRFRFALGGRVDKFGNIDKAVFSPRVMAMYKPGKAHSIRASFNKAFRAPSAINNFLDQKIVTLTPDLSPLAPFLPPPLRPFATRLPLVVNNVGNPGLQEESLRAYELAYTGTFNNRTTVGIAIYRNDSNDNINFTRLDRSLPGFVPYTPQDPPPGIPAAFIAILAALPPQFGGPILLPKVAATYLNLGPLRQDGVELSIDHAFNREWSFQANYSYQKTPEVLAAKSGQIKYPTQEVTLPPKNRFNASANYNGKRWFATLGVNYAASAFWTDVLGAEFWGATDSFTMVNASLGARWADGKITTSLKGTNLANQDIQQHIYGDIMKRSVAAEVRINVR